MKTVALQFFSTLFLSASSSVFLIYMLKLKDIVGDDKILESISSVYLNDIKNEVSTIIDYLTLVMYLCESMVFFSFISYIVSRYHNTRKDLTIANYVSNIMK